MSVRTSFLAILALLVPAGTSRPDDVDATSSPDMKVRVEPSLGGLGGVYLLASPGELVVDVFKRDRNRRNRRTELRAILVGPDRRVIQESIIPDDGQPQGSGLGPVQQTRLTAQVKREGVYALNVTVSQDRYGEEILWGFATNCARHVIETSRGHRDERHQEPILLSNPAAAGDVCFVPRAKPFAVEVTGLPKTVDKVTVFDSQGTPIETMSVDAQGRAAHTFDGAAGAAEAPWRLHLPVQQAVIHIDGVTRWDPEDLYPNLSFWTTSTDAYFPLHEYRWLLTPYSRTVYARPGAEGEIVFRVHNNSDRIRTVHLAVEFPDGAWPVKLEADGVVLDKRQDVSVSLRYTAAADSAPRICHVRATPVDDRDFTTYSTLEVRAGEPPAAKPLSMPLALKPYRHENEQFGHLTTYPVDSQPYFDMQNRPFVGMGSAISTPRNGGWRATDLIAATPAREDDADRTHYRLASTKLAFDRDNHLYALAMAGRQAALLQSADGGQTFSACTIPDRETQPRSFDFEQFSGHNVPDDPPPILRYTRTARDPKLFWRRLHDLELFLPRRVDGRLSAGDPILISRECIGLASHSGIPANVVSRDGKVHVVWAEATEPEEKVPGVPTYVVTCDRATGRLSEPALVGYGAPPNDIHNTPSITMDSKGYLHVVAGTHGRPFPYARSLKPNDASGGWTDAQPVGENLRQTYIGLVCGLDDTLHLAYRLWRYGEAPHPASHHATLAYQRKPPGKPWQPPEILVVPPFSEYSVFYHRLTIDRQGRLFLSYDYWSTLWFYRNDHLGNRRSLLMSPDGGGTWKLTQDSDLMAEPAPQIGVR
jgi:hypothetical protein